MVKDIANQVRGLCVGADNFYNLLDIFQKFLKIFQNFPKKIIDIFIKNVEKYFVFFSNYIGYGLKKLISVSILLVHCIIRLNVSNYVPGRNRRRSIGSYGIAQGRFHIENFL